MQNLDHSSPAKISILARNTLMTAGITNDLFVTGEEFPNTTQSVDMLSVDLLSGASGDALDNGSPQSISMAASESTNKHSGEVELTEQPNADAHPTNTASLFDSSMSKPSSFDNNPQAPSAIYQLNFDVEHIGKKKPQSKRQATWTYGFPKNTTDENWILEEHETRLTWSTHSGKYLIEVDGQVVFEGVAKGSVLEHKFIYNHTEACVGDDSSEEGYIRMRVIACRKPPTRSSTNFRCYEFVIGGCVFRDLARNNHYGEDFHNEDSRDDVGVLSSILDIVDPSWRSAGMA